MPKAGCVPMEGTHTAAVWEELQPGRSTTLENFVEDCLLCKEPHAGAGEEWEESSPERKE